MLLLFLPYMYACLQIGGVGKVLEKTLKEVGVHTCGDLLANMAAVWHVSTPHQR
jgi:nucleotidyltransferase/DNA polymerase involved in DNA repair